MSRELLLLLTFLRFSCIVATLFMKQITILFLVSFATAVFLTAQHMPVTVSADGSNCLPIYNGGVTSQQYCINPTPTPASVGFPNQNQSQQTTGGQPIYPSSQTKTTPNTGPADWALPALFLLGATGLLLKKKAKIA